MASRAAISGGTDTSGRRSPPRWLVGTTVRLSRSPTTRTPEAAMAATISRAISPARSRAHWGVSIRASSGPGWRVFINRAAPKCISLVWRALPRPSCLKARLNARMASTSASVSERLARSWSGTRVPSRRPTSCSNTRSTNVRSASSRATTVTFRVPTTSAQRAISWSCRCRSQNVRVIGLAGLLSTASSHRSYDAPLPAWTFCCHCEGRIRDSGRRVTAMCTRAG